MIPGETWHAQRGTPSLTVVVVSKGEDHEQPGVDPTWNVAVHTPGQHFRGMTFISNLHVGTVISHVPTQPEDARFIIKVLKKRRALDIYSPKLLVVVPEAEEREASKMMPDGPRPKFEWPRRQVSVWDLVRKPAL